MAQFFAICALLMFSGVSEAMSRKSALTVELTNLGRFIDLYHDQEGEYPQTWNELKKIDPDLDGTFSILKPTQRMMLISPPLELPKRHGGGTALAITREPFRPMSWTQRPIIGGTSEHLEEPSYGVIVTIDGGIFLRRISPDATRSVFESAGLALPTPSGLGAFPHEKQFMARRILSWVTFVAVASLLTWWVIGRLKNPKSEQDAPSNGG
jgi:hypothetical protein